MAYPEGDSVLGTRRVLRLVVVAITCDRLAKQIGVNVAFLALLRGHIQDPLTASINFITVPVN
jgi:uncharacterized membrane protein